MSMKKMYKKGKRIAAIVLSFAMMIPLALSQTSVVKAEDTPQKSALLTFAKDTKISMERGDSIILSVTPAKEFTITDGAGFSGCLHFQSKTVDPDTGKPADLKDNFRIVKVSSLEGWSTGFRQEDGNITVVNAGEQKLTTKDVLAKVEVEVLKTTNEVTISLDSIQLGATVASGGINSDASEKNTYISTDLSNSNKGNHGVTLSMPSTINVSVSSDYATDNFTVPISIDSNTGFNGIILTFDYEPRKLVYQGYKLSSRAITYLNCMTENPKNGTVSLCFVGKEDTKFTGDLLTLEFQPIGGTVGDTTKITPTIAKISDVSGVEDLKGSIAGSKGVIDVSFVAGKKLGDVNQDGEINLIDVTYALQKYNEIRELTPEQFKLADVNQDGKITLVDVLKIMKYCNGEITSFK